MRYNLFLVSFLPSLLLTACLEPQPAPNLPSYPSSDFNVETVVENLSSPWAVAELPDGSFLITEKNGQLWRITNGTKTKISGLPENIFTAGQGGLLDVVIAPNFADTNHVYLSYAYGTNDANGTALIRAVLGDNSLNNSLVIFRSGPPKMAASHFGGRIVFLPDNTLILTLGDGFAYREAAQDLSSHLGKIIRLNRDGGVPLDNPYKSQFGARPQTYSMGHRNVQGAHYDSETQTLWTHEHGPRGGDELNITQGGENYGWPIATYGLDYNGAKISPFKTYDGMKPPNHTWTPSIAPSGLTIYRGDLFPEWQGDALVGGLASRDLRRLDLENGAVIGEIRLLTDLDVRIRDVRTESSGAVLVLTDDPQNGKLLRIKPKE